MEHTPDFRPLLTRIIDRWLHGPRAERCRDHCNCVVELKTQLGIARWLIGLAITAALGALLRSGCDLAGLRAQLNPPPSNPSENMPGLNPRK